MRKMLLAIAAVGTLASIALPSTPASAQDYPFCVKGRDYPGHGDCRFPSYAACQAYASGQFLYCDRNPFYAGYTAPPRRKKHRRVYHEGY